MGRCGGESVFASFEKIDFSQKCNSCGSTVADGSPAFLLETYSIIDTGIVLCEKCGKNLIENMNKSYGNFKEDM